MKRITAPPALDVLLLSWIGHVVFGHTLGRLVDRFNPLPKAIN